MTKIIGIAGSLRAGSLNVALLRATGQLMPDGASLEIASIKGIPLYDGDVEVKSDHTTHMIGLSFFTKLAKNLNIFRKQILASPRNLQ